MEGGERELNIKVQVGRRGGEGVTCKARVAQLVYDILCEILWNETLFLWQQTPNSKVI